MRRRPRPASALQPPAGESPVPSPGLELCDLCAASDKLSQTKSRVLSQNRHSRPSEVNQSKPKRRVYQGEDAFVGGLGQFLGSTILDSLSGPPPALWVGK